jgi:hypothetical protein
MNHPPKQAALIDYLEEIHPGRSDPTPQKASSRFNLKESNNQQTPRNPKDPGSLPTGDTN